VRDQLQARLAELEAEFEIGERRWHEVELQQTRLRETLMRMSGAIQVLREILDGPGSGDSPESGSTSLNAHDESTPWVNAVRSGEPQS
jgi:hypothetical protein